MPRLVVTHHPSSVGQARRHDRACQTEIARRLAALMSLEFAGEYDKARHYPCRPYFVPSAPLLDEEAQSLGIATEDDLFGAIIPHAFVATKAISHPVLQEGVLAPEGWPFDLGARLAYVVLSGFTAFTPADVLAAGTLLLERGPVRLKAVGASAGAGQWVASCLEELIATIEAQDLAEMVATGCVIEENLTDVTTYTVGETRAAGQVLGYFGTQQLTLNNRGEEAYGGSSLTFVRGGMTSLLGIDLDPRIRRAIEQAGVYQAAIMACFPGLHISRRNYDVAQGRNGQGEFCSGVLEQSWRIGGASPAEIAALEQFQRDPTLDAVHARSVEIYGSSEIPEGAVVYFQGTDEKIGSLTKYVVVET